MVTGLTTMPDSNFLTCWMCWACTSGSRLRWITPIPPACAMAMASGPSVTVSMAAEIIGMFSLMLFVRFVVMSTSEGSTFERLGWRSTSSKVSPVFCRMMAISNSLGAGSRAVVAGFLGGLTPLCRSVKCGLNVILSSLGQGRFSTLPRSGCWQAALRALGRQAEGTYYTPAKQNAAGAREPAMASSAGLRERAPKKVCAVFPVRRTPEQRLRAALSIPSKAENL